MKEEAKAKFLIEKAWDLNQKFNLGSGEPNYDEAVEHALNTIEQIETITQHYPPEYMLTVYWNKVKELVKNYEYTKY